VKYPNFRLAPLIALIVPLVLCASALFVSPGCGGGGSSPTPVPNAAAVAIAFVGGPPQAPPVYRNIFFNVSAIRLNPQASPSPTDPQWVSISVPTGAGNTTPGNVQLDINNLRAQSQLFNIGNIPAGTYQTIQVVLDQSQPGMVVPTCQASNGGFEGCITYPMALFNPGQSVQRTLSQSFNASANNLSTLLLTLGVTINQTPAGTGGGSYQVTPTLEVNPVNDSNKSNLMGTITVTVNVSGSPGSHVQPLTITAESAGTRNIVATLTNVNPGTQYPLTLPAAPQGTYYDIYVNGGGYSFAATRNVQVTPAQGTLLSLNVVGVAQNGFGGQITNGCAAGQAIPGALIELLAPPSNSTVNCSTDLASASKCVIVGSDFSDNVGNYPLPATTGTPSLLSEVPLGNYALLITANGYGQILTQASLSSSGQSCAQSDVTGGCSFSMTNSTLTGKVQLGQAPQPGTSVQVQVFAENTGTNQLVSALSSPLIFGSANVLLPFSINVPPTASGATAQGYDLFATAIDPYLGATSPFPGHTIAVVSNGAAAPSACATATVSATLGTLDCAGHGSITGTVTNPDQNTTVGVIQDNVFITGTAPGFLESGGGSPPLPANTNFSFCVPPGQYTVQKYESGLPLQPPVTAVAQVPVPSPTSSPCPSSCSQSSTNCPGQCFAGNPVGPL